MSIYAQHLNKNKTPQVEKAREDQVQNNAGGFTFSVTPEQRLLRFLILGTDSGTYYANERQHTIQAASAIVDMIKKDGLMVLDTTVDVSNAARAPKNDAAIAVMAMLLVYGDEETRSETQKQVPAVCRIGTHWFQLAECLKAFGAGWGRAKQKMFARRYEDTDLDKLAYDMVKYQSRNGWSQADLIRLSHPRISEGERAALIRWALDIAVEEAREVERRDSQGNKRQVEYPPIVEGLPKIVLGFEKAKRAQTPGEVVELIKDYELPRECVPTEFLNDAKVWKALLYAGTYGMPMNALVRNLGKMTSVGLIKPLSDETACVVSKLKDPKQIGYSRLHPLAIAQAMKVYSTGQGMKGDLRWSPDQEVLQALNDAFRLSFGNVQATGKRFLQAVDVSGSMGFCPIAGSCLTPAEASAILAQLTVDVEDRVHTVAFSHELVTVNMKKGNSVDAVARTFSQIPMGGTDCSLPILYALENKIPVDVFVVYTDNETWCGGIHPFQALKKYRKEMGVPAKLVVCGMTATQFTIADPSDAGMLDVVGFDTATPGVIEAFVNS